MSSENIGIEEARKRLGDLVNAAQQGTDIVLTRHGRPLARIVPIEETPMPTMSETLATYRHFATVPTVVDTLHYKGQRPSGAFELSKAQLAYEAAPFIELLADIDDFFGSELNAALTGPESADAETEVRRIIAEHIAKATVRLALIAAALSADLTSAAPQTLQTVAGGALQRAADLRFVEVVSPAVKVATS